MKITNRLRGICRVYPHTNNEKPKDINMLELGAPGSQPIMLENLPGHWSTFSVRTTTWNNPHSKYVHIQLQQRNPYCTLRYCEHLITTLGSPRTCGLQVCSFGRAQPFGFIQKQKRILELNAD